MTEPFDPNRYWNERHARTDGLEGVGYLGLMGFNEWMYRVRRHVFRRLVQMRGIRARGARVLDVGSGTGFYIEEWLRLGAQEVVGVDISEVACDRLRRSFPGTRILRFDITVESPEMIEQLGKFDLISAMDVLYHLVDDARYQRALVQMARLLEPSGRLIFTENFLHGPRIEGVWQVNRNGVEIERNLRDAGLALEQVSPWFVLMNNPIDSNNFLLALHWKLIDRVARRSRLGGAAIGAALFPIELALTKIVRESPTSKIAIARRQ